MIHIIQFLKKDEYYPLLKLKKFTEEYTEFNNLLKPCISSYENSVALIFTKPSSIWGLRGDSYFWTYLEKLFIDIPIPMDINEFDDIFRFKFHKFNGGKELVKEPILESLLMEECQVGRYLRYGLI